MGEFVFDLDLLSAAALKRVLEAKGEIKGNDGHIELLLPGQISKGDAKSNHPVKLASCL